MTKPANNTLSLYVDDPEDAKGKLKGYGGSQSDRWNEMLLNQAANSLVARPSQLDIHEKESNATIAAMKGIAPKDELEGMMAAQLVAAHNATMECYRRAMHPEQTAPATDRYLNHANKLSRTWATLLEALNKHRGKGQQKVTVEHVHVHSGGQAIVGSVEAGGGGAPKLEDQAHAKLTHAPQHEMRSEDEERATVPIAGDA